MKHIPADARIDPSMIRESKGVNLSRLSPESLDVTAIPDPPKGRPRYGRSQKIEDDGHKFDSAREHRRYRELRLMQLAEEIADLDVHPVYPLVVNGELVYTYTADFRYSIIRGGSGLVVDDVKSEGTRKKDSWRLVRKLFKALYGIEITEVIES
jgi:hypothetical protein